MAALSGGELVGGASSYTCYSGGYELQVETREDMRRRGVALACCARLILTCLDRGLYPSWDAANLESVALARRLGYRSETAFGRAFRRHTGHTPSEWRRVARAAPVESATASRD